MRRGFERLRNEKEVGTGITVKGAEQFAKRFSFRKHDSAGKMACARGFRSNCLPRGLLRLGGDFYGCDVLGQTSVAFRMK